MKQLPSNKLNYVNLGCGTRAHSAWINIDFSIYSRLQKYRNFAKAARKLNLISDRRWERLNRMDPDIICWDLRKGIPLEDNSCQVVYHSHFIEHLPRETAYSFLEENYRVLMPGGILRVTIPNLKLIIQDYEYAIKTIKDDMDDHQAWELYDKSLYMLFDQMVRDQATGQRQQKGFVRFIEGLFRSDAKKTGELHYWMYDEYSLNRMLLKIGFKEIKKQLYNTSSIDKWQKYCLDQDSNDTEYIPGTLYLESRKFQ
jgi:predicted SAM-dependent methyltransferase